MYPTFTVTPLNKDSLSQNSQNFSLIWQRLYSCGQIHHFSTINTGDSLWADLICTPGQPNITSGGPISFDLSRPMCAHAWSPDRASLRARSFARREHQAALTLPDYVIRAPVSRKSNSAFVLGFHDNCLKWYECRVDWVLTIPIYIISISNHAEIVFNLTCRDPQKCGQNIVFCQINAPDVDAKNQP